MIRILHVDDEEGMLALTRDFLEQSGHFAVTTAQSAEIAWDLLRREPFDAVVSDYQMPAMDGIELLRAVRNSGWDIPFIIFTGKGREEVVVEAIDAGVDFYLQKGGRPRSQFAELAHKIQSAVERKSAERALRASERNFRQIFNTAPNLMLALDHEGTIVDCNSRVIEVLGFTPDELIGRKLNTLAPGTRSASIETAINNLLRQGAVTAFDTLLVTQSGHAIEGRISASVMKGREGSPGRIICAIDDITSRERARRALFEEKERLKVTLRSIGDGVIVTDAGGRISLMNDVASELTGWEEEDAGGRLLEEVFCIINEESRVPCTNPVDRVMSSGMVVDLANHTILIASDGTERMIADSAAPIHDDDGRVTGVVLVFRDVTEKRQREDEIRMYAREYQSLADTLPHIIYRADPDGNITFMNRSGLEALDVSEAEVIGQPFIPNIHPDDVESGLGVFQRILSEGTAVHNFECRFMTRRGRGREIPVLTNVTPLYDESGRIIGTQGIALDITEKKHMEDVLHEREVQLRFILDQLPITLWTTDRDLRFTSSLGAALPSLGLEPNQVVGMQVAEFYEGHEGSDIALDAHRKALSGEQIWYEAQFGDLTFSAHLQPLFGRDGSIGGAVGFGFDITERKNIEESLRESREQLQLAMDAASLGMWDWDILHNRIMVSRKGADMLALDGKEGDDDWQYHIDPDRLPPVSEKLRAHLDGETPVFENEIIVRDRSDETRWIRETGKVIARTPEGAPLRMTGIINDETERIQVQENLRRANQKLNLLASVTRHDILNQTMTLAGMYELLADEIGGDSPQVIDYLRILREAIERIQNQISFTRDYQHIGVESPRWQRVERVLGPAADHARASGLEVRIMADGLEIFSDPLLEKVFFNLVDNTVRHGGGATTITVTFTEDTDGGILCVEDDGVGIPTPEKERVFERGVGKNTGFGLFLAREILGLGGIPLWETGEEGMGARFEMVVPRGQYRWKTG